VTLTFAVKINSAPLLVINNLLA